MEAAGLANVPGLLLVVAAGMAGYVAGGLIHASATRLPAGLPVFGPPVCSACLAVEAGRYRWLIWPGSCPHGARPVRHTALATRLVAASLSVAAVLRYGTTREAVAVLLFSLLLLLILLIDWQHHLIFTVTIFPGIGLALVLAALDSLRTLASATLAGAGAAAVFGLFFLLGMLLYRRAALGAGDILLAGLIGTMTGMRVVVPALFLGMAAAALVGILLVVLRRKGRMDYIPYGAYLCAGTIVALFRWGPAG
jgi:leader peptidase (prepilin peptidase)/N-methyltransferase